MKKKKKKSIFDTVKIQEAVTNLFDLDRYKYCDFTVEARIGVHKEHDAVFVKIQKMYDQPDISGWEGGLVGFLTDLQKAMTCTQLDINDEYGHGGCETCDYGSCYGKEYVGWNE